MRPLCLLLVLLSPVAGASAQPVFEGAGWTDFGGYTRCPVLSNDTTRVVLGPHCGGRILDYSYNSLPAIPLNPAQEGFTWKPGDKIVDPYGGRFDIGPEVKIPRHTDLWLGPWTACLTGPREAMMVSPVDTNTGIQLFRYFRLAEEGSYLRCTQKMLNRSTQIRQACYWSRTFGLGNGVCVVPLNPRSRFPRGYLTYGPGAVMDYSPNPHENVRVRDGFLEIRGTPPFSKFMVDVGGLEPLDPNRQVEQAWLAYVMPGDLMFVKRWNVYPQRPYGEMCAAALSLYYYPFTEDREKPPAERALPIDFCELEPIGPQETLRPGESATFTEEWWLAPQALPAEGADLDLVGLQRDVTNLMDRNGR